MKIFNTLSKQKEEFIPINPKNVRMYVCGPTVYGDAHIGNARPAVVFDVLYRLLIHKYGFNSVNYVRNITDIDDKINNRATEIWDGRTSLLDTIKEITSNTEAQYLNEMNLLGNLSPTHSPKATDYVQNQYKTLDMITMIRVLVEKRLAYVVDDHVFFNSQKLPENGILSNKPLYAEGFDRIQANLKKSNNRDFVLWKPSNSNQPGWDSPWGYGRPGWHIECSAMSGDLLGEKFDIHGGGIDLMNPHHENEIAQSCGYFGISQHVNYWMHNGFINIDDKKMSKSSKNIISIKDLLKDWPGSTLRYRLLSTHYRQPMTWKLNTLVQIHKSLEDVDIFETELAEEKLSLLYDDLNTPLYLNSIKNNHSYLKFIGIDVNDRYQKFDFEEIQNQLDLRLKYKKEKNFQMADEIANKLKLQGIKIFDRIGDNGDMKTDFTV